MGCTLYYYINNELPLLNNAEKAKETNMLMSQCRLFPKIHRLILISHFVFCPQRVKAQTKPLQT
jgi:hypothetical protein